MVFKHKKNYNLIYGYTANNTCTTMLRVMNDRLQLLFCVKTLASFKIIQKRISVRDLSLLMI
jgi:hypothetical protein